MLRVELLPASQNIAGLIAVQPLNPYLQSPAWAEFQQALGRKVWRFGALNGDRLVGSAMVIEHQLMLGKCYLYCPHGPLSESPEAVFELYEVLRQLGKRERSMYVKIDPPVYRFPFGPKDFPTGFSSGTTLQPATTLVVDTAQSPEILLEQMHPKTRYNIRLAERKGVQARWSTDRSDYQRFMQLQQETADRQGIRLHPQSYYDKMFNVLVKAKMCELLIGEYQGKIEAALMIVWSGQTATYLHGGSSTARKEAMVPYLLQWRAMEECHRRGIRAYDFRGIAPEGVTDHKLAGVTRFKKGFGGRVVEYPPAANAVLQKPWYVAYRYAKRFRGGSDD